ILAREHTGVGATAPAAVVESTALALPHITRAQVNQMLKARTVELYQDARSAQQQQQQQQQQRDFEAQHGGADRIDAALFGELQHLQLRLAAIAACQQRQLSGQEPKVNKFVRSLGEIIVGGCHRSALQRESLGAIHANRRARVTSATNGSLGRKGYDESVFAQYHIVDDPQRTASAQDSGADPDEPLCLRETVEPDQGAYQLRAVLDTDAKSTAAEKTLTPVVMDWDGSYGRIRCRSGEPYFCCLPLTPTHPKPSSEKCIMP
ncbi:MAG: hypothetical protein ABSB70_22765, partial [Candidatus Velthaea sp.]